MTGAPPAAIGPASAVPGGVSPALRTGYVLAALAIATAVWPLTTLPWLSIALTAVAVSALVRTPAASLAVCLGLYGLTLGYNEGLQPEEVVFVLYYPVFIGGWLVLRGFVYQEPVIRDVPDRAMAAFVFLVLPLAFVVGQLFGGRLGEGVNELLSYSLLSLYFPAKEIARRYEWGGPAILGLLVVLGLGAIVQNAFLIREAFADAEAAWQIARGRVPMNEMLVTVGALSSVTYAALAAGARQRMAGLVMFAVFAGGLAMTQSRAYYVDLALGLALLPLVLGAHARVRYVLSILSGGVVVGVLGYALLGESAQLVVLGIVDRVLSIGTAASSDISYLNRLLENRAAWERIGASPVVGNGLGVPFSFYDAIYKATWTKTFVHNGYLMLWFKFGLVGLSAVLAGWLGSAFQALKAARDRRDDPAAVAITTVATGVTLVALLPSHMLSATFATSETVLCVALLMGVAGGCAARRTPGTSADAV